MQTQTPCVDAIPQMLQHTAPAAKAIWKWAAGTTTGAWPAIEGRSTCQVLGSMCCHEMMPLKCAVGTKPTTGEPQTKFEGDDQRYKFST